MKYGICNLTLIPLRASADHRSEMVSQLLFGEAYKVTQANKLWLKIAVVDDGCEGWIPIEQHLEVSKEFFREVKNSPMILSDELVDVLENEQGQLTTIVMGSRLPLLDKNRLCLNEHTYHYQGRVTTGKLEKTKLIPTAFRYENVPFLWGGKTPFGLDSAGFTQIVYKLNGIHLKRNAAAQATQGEALSFIEESSPGDLAFFDNQEGEIIHVGMILENHHIIHVDGKVRVDQLDQSGIFNRALQKHTYKLRVIKKVV
ncbi:C40 family peptidase [Flavobacteriaceae bacterium F08102]|nr:C40 family peptidase [Flavobacteriaceae bacterium F08102]